MMNAYGAFLVPGEVVGNHCCLLSGRQKLCRILSDKYNLKTSAMLVPCINLNRFDVSSLFHSIKDYFLWIKINQTEFIIFQ